MSLDTKALELIKSLSSRIAELERWRATNSSGKPSGSISPLDQKVRIEDAINFAKYINQELLTSSDVTFNTVNGTALPQTIPDGIEDLTNKDHSLLTNKNAEADVQHLTAAQVAALHARYTDAEAVTAMGAKADANALNHDKTTSLAWSAIDKTTSDIADITTKSHTSLSDKGTNTHAQIDTHITNEPASSIATHAALAAAHHTKYTDAEAKAAAVNDTAYDATSWNAVTDVAPSKNVVRDEFEVLLANLVIGSANAQWIPAIPVHFTNNGFYTDTVAYHPLTTGTCYFFAVVNLPTTIGSLKLYIDDVRLTLTQADANNKITQVWRFGYNSSGRTIIDTVSTGWTSAAEHVIVFSATDIGTSYKYCAIQCASSTTTVTSLDLTGLEVKYYYA